MASTATQANLYSAESDVFDMEIARLEYRMKQSKRGHVTWASMKVIALIGAWTSIVLLVCLQMIVFDDYKSTH